MMRSNRGHSSMPSALLLIVGAQLLALEALVIIECKPMFFAAPLAKNHHYHPPPPIVEEPPTDYDDYVILSDDELVHDAAILQHLMLATKEEIEELVEENPQVQSALLEKIHKVLDQKEALEHGVVDNVYQFQGDTHSHHHRKGEAFHKHSKGELIHKTKDTLVHNPKKEKLLVNYDNFKHSLKDQYHEELEHLRESDHHNEDDPLQAGLDRAKVEMLRAKLKNKAAKLFKIGGSLKKRVMALKRKKLKDKKLRRYEDELAHREAEEEAIEEEVEEAAHAAPPVASPEGNVGPARPNFHFSMSTGR